MEQFLFTFIHLGIPVLVALALVFHRAYTKIGLLATSLFYVSVLWFIVLWGQWAIAASVYFKYVVIVILIFAMLGFPVLFKSRARLFPKGLYRNLKNGILIIASGFCLLLIFELYQGRNYPEMSVTLEFPLRNGKFYVASGGANRIINNHFGTIIKSQQYAIDINKVGKWGRASNFFGTSSNQAHYIFGEDVYCPCEGKVLEVVKGVEDNMGSSMNVKAENGGGNFISLDCDNTIVSLVHLKNNSITVSLGQSVRVGELIGKVGNSGFSQEPHLHLQASRRGPDSTLLGIPMTFDGRQPLRNDIIKN